jgi:hypothetical protein
MYNPLTVNISNSQQEAEVIKLGGKIWFGRATMKSEQDAGRVAALKTHGHTPLYRGRRTNETPDGLYENPSDAIESRRAVGLTPQTDLAN